MSSIPCGSIKHEGHWADCEIRQLKYTLLEGLHTHSIFNERGKIDWLIVASKILGRSSKSWSDKYHKMVSAKIIDDIEQEIE